jgi:lysine-N-methylase
MSGLISCPEITRRLLSNSNPIRFTRTEYSSGAQFVYQIYNTGAQKSKWQFFAPSIRDLTIEILQDRAVSLTDRLIFLGLFFQKAKDIARLKVEEIPALVSQYRNLRNNSGIKNLAAGISRNLSLQYQILKALCEIRANESPAYRELYLNVLEGLGYLPDNPTANLDNYENVVHNYYNGFFNEKSYLLEQYLVNYVFSVFFPFCGSADIFESYTSLVLHYSIMQFHLLGIAGLKKELDENLTASIFTKVSRLMEHDNLFFQKAHHWLQENNFVSLAHMVVLFKIS